MNYAHLVIGRTNMPLNADIIGMVLGWGALTWLFVIGMKALFAFLAKQEKQKAEATLTRRNRAVKGGFAETIATVDRELQQMHDYKPEVPYEQYEEYLDTKEWKALRQKVIKRDRNMCAQCGEKFASKELHVHHITYKRLKREHMEDLVSVCEFHHELIHDFRGKNAGYYPILSMGELSKALATA